MFDYQQLHTDGDGLTIREWMAFIFKMLIIYGSIISKLFPRSYLEITVYVGITYMRNTVEKVLN